MLRFRSLASGSSGNAYLLKTSRSRLLFDAGLRLPALERFLRDEDVRPEELTGVLLSHEHRDHCAAAAELVERYRVPIWANYEVLRAAGLHEAPSAAILDVGRPTLFGDVEVVTFPVSHDAVRPVGFVARTQQRTIVIATDLGRPTGEVAEAVAAADLLVLESNHDPEMLRRSRYPEHLRRRVAGPTGHLANNQAAEVLIRHVKREDVEVWLAHLSRNNNTPSIALRTVTSMLKTMGLGALHVGVAKRDRPSLVWTGLSRPTQLALFPLHSG